MARVGNKSSRGFLTSLPPNNAHAAELASNAIIGNGWACEDFKAVK